MTMELALRIVGLSHIALALAHVPMARQLNWQRDLTYVPKLTRQVFWSHTLFVCLILTMMGTLSAAAPATLLTPSPLGRYVTLALTIFWSMRLVSQWLFFEWSHWWGKRLETFVHGLFTATWVTYVVVYGNAFRLQL